MAEYRITPSKDDGQGLDMEITVQKLDISLARTGPQGARGLDGAILRSGSGTPANSLGNNGDFYFNTDDNLLFAKIDGSWDRIIDGGSVATVESVTFDSDTRELTLNISDGTSFEVTIPAADAGNIDTDYGMQMSDQYNSTTYRRVDSLQIDSDTGLEIVEISDGVYRLQEYVAPTEFNFDLVGTPASRNVREAAPDFTLEVDPVSGTTVTSIKSVTATKDGNPYSFDQTNSISSNVGRINFTGSQWDSEGLYVISVTARGVGSDGLDTDSETKSVSFRRTSNNFGITLSGVPNNSDIAANLSDFTVTAAAIQHTTLTSVTRARIQSPAGGGFSAIDTEVSINSNGISATFEATHFERPGRYTITLTASGTDSNGSTRTGVTASGSYERTYTYAAGTFASRPAASAATLAAMTDQNDPLSVNDSFTVTGSADGARVYLAVPGTGSGPTISASGSEAGPRLTVGTFTLNDVTWSLYEYAPIDTNTRTFTVVLL